MTVMEDYAGRRGWTIVAQVQDIGSGVKKRPDREELIKLANRRELDVIIVWRLDRWGRSLSDLTENLEDLRAIGLDFVSPGRAMAGCSQFSPMMRSARLCKATPPRWRYGLLLVDVRLRIIPVRRFKRSARLVQVVEEHCPIFAGSVKIPLQCHLC